jgi:hypothetical protein
MMNGASTLEAYTPGIDATIVTRILDAGGIRDDQVDRTPFLTANAG